MRLIGYGKSSGYVFLVLIIAVFLTGCAAFNLRVAENYYTEFAYSRAIPKYESVLRKTFNTDAASKLADSYRKTGNSVKAEFWYRRLAVSNSISLADKLNFAEVLMENGKYSEAKTWFDDYLKLNATDKRVRRLLQACDSIHLFFEDTLVYNISLLTLNKGSESNFSPSFFKDGIVFLSDRSAPGKNRSESVWTGKEYLDLFYAVSADGQSWSEPELLKGDVNGFYDEGPAVFTGNETEIYFTRTDYTGKVVEKNMKNVSTLKLYHGKLVDNNWTLQSLLHFNSKDFSVGHPTISADGKTLYFVSDMPWGYGGTDIYRVAFRNGEWSTPVNLGSMVNSEGNEMFPFLATDSILYFASDGYIGLGGLDIYSSEWNGEVWSKPENLQYPVNSSKDDFGFIINAATNKGYFSSNRKKNQDMIFGFVKNPPVFKYLLDVKEFKTGKSIRTFEFLTQTKKGDYKSAGTATNGHFEMDLSRNTEYQGIVKSNGYYAINTRFSTVGKRKSEDIAVQLELRKIELNKSAVWKDIYFPKKESAINPSTAVVLDSLALLMKLNPEVIIEIAVHTDSRGSYVENLTLSKNRADIIAAYLVSKGCEQARLSPVGFGEGKLLNNCRDGILCLEEDHRVNNRVEIKVISLAGK